MRKHHPLSGFAVAIVSLAIAGSCTHGVAELSPSFQELEDRIEGRENEPAEEVFDNIQIMKGMPAERVLTIMTNGFAPALGVSCDYCHVPGDWASDEKDHKRIARDMWRMTGEINKQVKTIVDDGARVNCTTCHRGETDPALEMH